MRIAYVTGLPIPSRSANSVQVMKMCHAFTQCGHDVTLLVPHFTDEPGIEDPFRYYGVGSDFIFRRVPWHPRALGRYWYALLAAVIAKTADVDLIYGRSPHACLLGCLLGIPTYCELHDFISERGPGTRWIFSRLIRRRQFTRLVVTSEAAQTASREFDLAPERIILARNAASEPREVELFEFAGSERLQVGYVGHLYPGKGMEIVLLLAAACPWADFHVVGGLESDLARWRARSSGQPNLTFHGFASPAATDRYRLSCDVLLAPYQRTVQPHGGTSNIAASMSPLKLFEYMAAGKAILCSDLPILQEILIHGETAIFCEPDIVSAWTEALARLRDNPELRRHLGAAARDVFRERYTLLARATAVLGE